MKYSVVVPAPSAKRMRGSGKLIVTYNEGWDGIRDITYGPKETTVMEIEGADAEFEVPDKYEWIGSTSILDGFSFTVKVEYSNKTGSRKEEHVLVPKKLY
jgi:hypothetical protein